MAAHERLYTSLDLATFGIYGTPFDFQLVPVFDTAAESAKVASIIDGTENGLFIVTMILGVSDGDLGPGERNTLRHPDDIEGNSLLILRTKGAPSSARHVVEIEKKPVECHFYTNANNALSKITVGPFAASSFDRAIEFVDQYVLPTLSLYSVLADVPMVVGQVDVEEIATSVQLKRTTIPFQPASIGGLALYHVSDEAKPLLALYREALNSGSSVYQCLCYFKIIEGAGHIWRQRTSRLGVQSSRKRLHRVPRTAQEIRAWIDHVYPSLKGKNTNCDKIIPPQFYGRKVTDVVNNELRPLRNLIAHAFLNEGDDITYIESRDIRARVHRLLRFMRFFARHLLIEAFPHELRGSRI